MFWSKSDFFKQNIETLIKKRKEVIFLLDAKEISSKYYLSAFDYFVINPTEFDGATIVKDLKDIKGLDLSAMVHDYQYIVELTKYKGISWLKVKTRMDWNYGRSMELLGKGIYPYTRSIGLIISTPIYWVIKQF